MFTLPKLPYDYNALEPYIDARTMEIHHSKHHQGYVDKLNAAIEGIEELKDLTIEELLTNPDKVPVGKKDAVRNNGGGHYNHTLFWDILTPGGPDKPSGKLMNQITQDFGSLETMIEHVSEAAATQFGSGWGWLVVNKEKKLEAVSTPNQDAPLLFGYKPVIGIDIWEHAYYLKYQNLRPEYVKAFWNVVNWDKAAQYYQQAQ